MPLLKLPSFTIAVYMQGNPDSRKLALILPGRLDTKDYPHMKSNVNFLASRGYLALSFDPPGTWESPGEIKLYTMTNYLKVINELINHFGNKPTVLFGHSLGGSMAMLAGTQNKHVTHIITAMSRPTPNKIRPGDRSEISLRDIPKGGTKKFILPLSYFEDAAKYNMLEALSKCKKPKLFFYGRLDQDIAPEVVKETYNLSAEPKQIYQLNCDHDYRKVPKRIREINKVMGEFLETYKD